MEEKIKITERKAVDVMDELISLSAAWEEENSCHGYRRNQKEDIEGRRVFTAEKDDELIGYLFGVYEVFPHTASILLEGTPVFELEELFVRPEFRNRGVGKQLFEYAESAVKDNAEYLMLSTAAKNWKAILHFYLDELGMEFWNARLYKKIR